MFQDILLLIFLKGKLLEHFLQPVRCILEEVEDIRRRVPVEGDGLGARPSAARAVDQAKLGQAGVTDDTAAGGDEQPVAALATQPHAQVAVHPGTCTARHLVSNLSGFCS